MAERYEVKLTSGRTLHELSDGEGRLFGHFEVQEDGTARQWVQVWHDEFRVLAGTPVYPGPVSIMRAFLRGEI